MKLSGYAHFLPQRYLGSYSHRVIFYNENHRYEYDRSDYIDCPVWIQFICPDLPQRHLGNYSHCNNCSYENHRYDGDCILSRLDSVYLP